MIADDGATPILMDFGSAMKARVRIENRNQALLQQVSARFHVSPAQDQSGGSSGHCSGKEHDGVPRAGALRRQDGGDD